MSFFSRTRAELLPVCLLAMVACTNSPAPDADEASTVAGETERTEPVDITMPELKAPPMAERPDGSTSIASSTSTINVESPAVPTPGTASANNNSKEPSTALPKDPDVGYEGLKKSIDSIESLARPLLIANASLDPKVAQQLFEQSRDLLKNTQSADSVEKELKYQLHDHAIELNAAFLELKQAPPGPRYDQLRALASERIELIQGLLLNAPAP